MSDSSLFHDRQAAGTRLAALILATQTEAANTLLSDRQPIVYGLPRGGLPIAEVVAQALRCPLDVWIAKKITPPQHPEWAIGAVTTSGRIVYPSQATDLVLTAAQWQMAIALAYDKVQQQAAELAPDRPQVDPQDRVAIVIDDGIATGLTMLAALQDLRALHPQALWVGVPVAPREAIATLAPWCDRLLVLAYPDPFGSVSRFYTHFPQVDLATARLALRRQQSRLIATADEARSPIPEGPEGLTDGSGQEL